MSERCPYCSFSPESHSDYCDEHRPTSGGAAAGRPSDEALHWTRDEMENMTNAVLEALGSKGMRHCAQHVQRLRAALASAEQRARTEEAENIWQAYTGMCRDDGTGFWHWLRARALGAAPTDGRGSDTPDQQFEWDGGTDG